MIEIISVLYILIWSYFIKKCPLNLSINCIYESYKIWNKYEKDKNAESYNY